MFTRGTMIGRIACVVSVFYLLLISPVLRAQSTTDGAIAGTVTDASGAAVPNASVMVTNKHPTGVIHYFTRTPNACRDHG